MSGSITFKQQRTGILSVEAVEAPVVVTSDWIDEQLAETYARNEMRPGLLQSVAGIKARRWWPEDVTFDEAAAMAGQKALDAAGISPGQVGLLISTSVCKHHLEPSVACAVHDRLGLPSASLNFDLGNACLGFVNGMQVAGSMIDSGQIDYALIVDGEGSRHTQETTLARLRRPETTSVDVFNEFASLTLGSGAAAMVLTSLDLHPEAHRVIGGVAKSATMHHRLCVGDLERMVTDTHGLLVAGLDLAETAWKDAAEHFDWELGMDWYIAHQVSAVHTKLLCERLGIPAERLPLTYPDYGNVGPAAIPITLAQAAPRISPRERVLCMGIGSGLNTSMVEIVW